MKFLIIAPRFHTNLYYRAKALQKAGHRVRVLVLYKGCSEFYSDIDLKILGYSSVFLFFNIFFSKKKETHLKSSSELRLGFPSLLKIRKEINDFNPDVILLKAYQNMLSNVVLLARLFTEIKVVVLTQTKKNHILKSSIFLRIYFKMIEVMGVTAYVSPIEKTQKVLSEIGLRNIFYIPFVFPTKVFARGYFRGDIVNIMMVGKFVERKNHLFLLKAFKSLVREGSTDLHLNIFGEKADFVYLRKIVDFIKKNKLDKYVTLRCNLKYLEILKEYTKNDLFVLPSKKEPAAYSIVEAMANKLPIICSDDCGTQCYVKKDVNGYIFKSDDLGDLKYKIKIIVKNRKKLVSMGKASHKLALDNHSLDKFWKNFDGIFN